MEIDRIGKVTNSKTDDWNEWYIKLVDDRHSTGGYLLLHCPQKDFKGRVGYDDWFLDLEDVHHYIAHRKLLIEWDN
jgi:hypothetical protein